MRHFKNLLIALVAVMTAGACSVNDEGAQASKAIRFTTNLERFTTKVTGTSFDKGDTVSLFAGSPIDDYNVKMTYGRGQLIPEHDVCWPEGITASTAVPFLAVYPYRAEWDIDSDQNIFSVNADQSTPDLYAASDLMMAETPAYPDYETVPLNFIHKLCRFELKVLAAFEDNVEDVFIADVYGKAHVGLDLDAAVTAVGKRGTVRMGKISEDWQEDYRLSTWNAILPAQNMSYKVVITTSTGKTVNYSVSGSLKRNYMEAGHQYSGAVDLTGDIPASDILVDVSAWTPDNDEQFGENVGAPDGEGMWTLFIPNENKEFRFLKADEGVFTLDFDYAGGEFILRHDRRWDSYVGSSEEKPTLNFTGASSKHEVKMEPEGFGLRLSDAGRYSVTFDLADTTLVVELKESYSAGTYDAYYDKYLGMWDYADESQLLQIGITSDNSGGYLINIDGYPVKARFDRASGGFEVYYQKAGEGTLSDLLLYSYVYSVYLTPDGVVAGALLDDHYPNSVAFYGKISEDGSSILLRGGRFCDLVVSYSSLVGVVQTEGTYKGRIAGAYWGPLYFPQTWNKRVEE